MSDYRYPQPQRAPGYGDVTGENREFSSPGGWSASPLLEDLSAGGTRLPILDDNGNVRWVPTSQLSPLLTLRSNLPQLDGSPDAQRLALGRILAQHLLGTLPGASENTQSRFDSGDAYSGTRLAQAPATAPVVPVALPGRVAPRTGGLNGKGYLPQRDDAALLARLIFAEGANNYKEPHAFEGIGWTAVNRIGERGFPDTLAGVIYQPNQFNAVTNNLWNRAANPAILTGDEARAYALANSVAEGIVNGETLDPVDGATFFHSGSLPRGFFTNQVRAGRLTSREKLGSFTFYGPPR
jgi:spore germination cell wall hydrolase CwlJ-like protein